VEETSNAMEEEKDAEGVCGESVRRLKIAQRQKKQA
jgi:hypothetical protein